MSGSLGGEVLEMSQTTSTPPSVSQVWPTVVTVWPSLNSSFANTVLHGLPQPNEPNETHKVYSIAIAIGVMCAVTVICVLWRLHYRLRNKIFGLDDYALILTALLYIAWSALGVHINIYAGVGKPLWEITMKEYSIWFKGVVAVMWMYPVMTTATRVSILLFYRRMFETPVTNRYNAWSITINVLFAAQFVYLVTFTILPAFICHPLSKVWTDPAHRERYMNDYYYYKIQIGQYISSMAFDVILLFLPAWQIWKLRMPVRRRIGAGALLVLGAGASLAAAIKLALLITEMYRYKKPASAEAVLPPQFNDYGLTFWIPSQVEPSIALLGASIPTIRQSLSQSWSSYFPGNRNTSRTSSELDREDDRLFDLIEAVNNRRGPSRGTAPIPLGGIKLTYTRHQTTRTLDSTEAIISEEERNGASSQFTPFTGTVGTTKVTISSSPRIKRV